MAGDPTPVERVAIDAMMQAEAAYNARPRTADDPYSITGSYLALLRAVDGETLVRLATERGPDEPHLVKFDEDGWTLKHPLKCRMSDLFDCAHHAAACRTIEGPPDEGYGVYEFHLEDDGPVLVGPQSDTETTT